MSKTKKILFIITEDWYFLSHRFDLAKFLIKNNFEVGLITNISNDNNKNIIINSGIKLFEWKINRSSFSIYKNITYFIKLKKIVKSYKPYLIISVAFKPIIFSILLSRICKKNNFILSFAGMGHLFISKKFQYYLMRQIVKIYYYLFINVKNTKLLFQNNDDKKIFFNAKYKEIKRLIPGSGVDTEYFINNLPDLTKKNILLMPTRLLKTKGVVDFIEISKEFKKNKLDIKFILIGDIDTKNPDSLKKFELEEYKKLDHIDILPKTENLLSFYQNAFAVCLLSYREGLPKTLLEGASCSLPLIAYDVPGCREIVKNSINGFLIPFKNKKILYEKISSLFDNKKNLNNMGIESRNIIISNFSNKIIFSMYLKLINEF